MQQSQDGATPKRRSKVLVIVLVILGVFVALWILVSLLVGIPAYRAYQERQAQQQQQAQQPQQQQPAFAQLPGESPQPAGSGPFQAGPAAPAPGAGPDGGMAAPGIADADAYIRQSKVNSALIAASQLKLEIQWHHRDRGVCPVNGVGEIRGANDYNGVTHRSMFVGRTADGDCGIEITLRDEAGDLPDGAKVWLEYAVANGSWRCYSDLPNDYLPADCRS